MILGLPHCTRPISSHPVLVDYLHSDRLPRNRHVLKRCSLSFSPRACLLTLDWRCIWSSIQYERCLTGHILSRYRHQAALADMQCHQCSALLCRTLDTLWTTGSAL